MFVVYNQKTTKIQLARAYGRSTYATLGAARAFLTRMVKKGYRASDFAIATLAEYHSIEKTVIVTNLLSGAAVTQSVNTPRCCDPSSELYHSM